MSTMKDLVSGACGGSNPLVKATQHANQNMAFGPAGVVRRNEDIHGAGDSRHDGSAAGFPHTFHMGELLHQTKQLEDRNKESQDPQFVTAPKQWKNDYQDFQQTACEDNPQKHDARNPSGSFLLQDVKQTPGMVGPPIFRPPAPLVLLSGPNIRKINHPISEEWSKDYQVKDNEPGILDTNTSEIEGQASSTAGLVSEKNDAWTQELGDVEDHVNVSHKPSSSVLEYAIARMEELELEVSSEDDSSSEEDGYSDEGLPYRFQKDNPYLDMNPEDAFEKGMEYLKVYDTVNATLMFEAALNTNHQNAKVWLQLGMAQAKNLYSYNAFRAFQKCYKYDPNMTESLLAMASVMQNHRTDAMFRALIEWVKVHPKYKHLKADNETRIELASSSASRGNYCQYSPRFKEAEGLLVQALRLNEENPDRDVLSSLGMLYIMNCEADKAIDLIQMALSMNQEDPVMWNKLGESYARGRNYGQAAHAFKKALELHPNYIEALHNLGKTCTDLECYRQAMVHHLTAMNLQHKYGKFFDMANGQKILDTTIWRHVDSICRIVGDPRVLSARYWWDFEELYRIVVMDPSWVMKSQLCSG